MDSPKWTHCNECRQLTKHTVVCSHSCQNSEDFDYDDQGNVQGMLWYETWEIITCNGCDEVSIRKLSREHEDSNEHTSIEYFPARNYKKRNYNYHAGMPTQLFTIYRQTVDAYNAKSFLLCAGGLRAIIEGLCQHLNITKGAVEKTNKLGVKTRVITSNLEGKIAGLAENGYLSQKQATALHEHRYLGNAALHALEEPTPEELRLGIDVIELVLSNVFELPLKVSLIQKQRTHRIEKKDTKKKA